MSISSIYIHGSHEEEQARLSRLNDLLNEKCLLELKLSTEKKILDVGSGLGLFSTILAKESNAYVLGVERDEKQLYKAQENTLQNLEFRRGDALDLPLKAGEWSSFDLVYCRFVLEHLRFPELAVQQMALAVKPGGRVVLADDDHAIFQPMPEPIGFSDLWNAYMQSYKAIGNDPLVGKRLITLLHRNGLRPSRASMVYFGACAAEPHFTTIAHNLIGILESVQDLMIQQQLISPAIYHQSMGQIWKWSELPDAVLWYSMNWAEGIK